MVKKSIYIIINNPEARNISKTLINTNISRINIT